MTTKSKLILTLTLMLACSMSSFSQNDTILWKKNFGGNDWNIYYGVTAVSDGIIAVGSSSTFNNGDWTDIAGKGGDDAIIVKYDNSGNVLWKKNFGGNGGDNYNSVTAVSDGIIAVGYSLVNNTGDWTGNAGKRGLDAIIVKYDTGGKVVWKKNFGGSGDDLYRSVTAVSDGIIAVGVSYGGFNTGDWTGIAGKGNWDAIIVKYDTGGNVLWQKNFGGNSSDSYRSVTAVSDGIIAVGVSVDSSFTTGDWTGIEGKGGDDAIIVKYDHSGNVLWKKNFGGNGDDYYRSVTAVSDGIIAVGYSQASSFNNGDWTGIAGKGSDDAIIVKYDTSGNVLWKKNFGGNGNDWYSGVTAVSYGIIAVGFSDRYSFPNGDWTGIAGKGDDDAIIVKYDNSGNVLWKKYFGGNGGDGYNGVTAVSDGIIAVGSSDGGSFYTGDWTGIAGKGDDDAIIVKYGAPASTGMEKLQVTPNPVPSNGTLHIENASLKAGDKIEIYDMQGKLLSTALASGAETAVNIGALPSGNYLLRLAGNKDVKFEVK